MSFENFMNKIRYLDNLLAKWLMRHFYLLFFQFVLLVVFLFWFVNMFNVIDTSLQVSKASVLERIMASQNINITIIVLLMLLNSFWLLYMFNLMQRIGNNLRDLSYQISRMRSKPNH